MTKRVWLSSPPTRTSVATGNESAGGSASGAAAAATVPVKSAPKRAQRMAWPDIGPHLIANPLTPLGRHGDPELTRRAKRLCGTGNPPHFAAKPTSDLPIPCPGPYEEYADG